MCNMYNSQLIQEITPLKSWDQKIDDFVNMSPLLRKSAEHYKAFGVSMMARLKAVSGSEWNYKNSIKSHTILLRTDGVHLNIDNDYGLSKVGVLYKEKGTLYFIVKYAMFNGCGYCGYCIAVLAQYFSRCCYCGCCIVVLAEYFSRCYYCGCCIAVLAQYFSSCAYSGCCIATLAQYFSRCGYCGCCFMVLAQ